MNETTETADAATIGAGTMTETDADAAIAQLRGQLDAIDQEIIGAVQRRTEISKQIQAVRMSSGGRRREHSRELLIVQTYVDGLGKPGSELALNVLEIARGRA